MSDYNVTDNIVSQIMREIKFHPNMVKEIIRFISRTLKEDKESDTKRY